MDRKNAVALLHGLAGATALVVGLLTKGQFLNEVGFVKPAGYVIFILGMLLFIFAAASLKRNFMGEVRPITNELVTGGPFHVVRHPTYLGMIIAVVGIAFGMKSLWGLVVAILVFAPLGIYRARLEEEALAEKFSQQWQEYAHHTYFMFPPIY